MQGEWFVEVCTQVQTGAQRRSIMGQFVVRMVDNFDYHVENYYFCACESKKNAINIGPKCSEITRKGVFLRLENKEYGLETANFT